MADQAQLCEACSTICKVALAPGKKDKENILKQGKSDYLLTLLNLAYDPTKTYRVQQIEQPSSYLPVQPDTMEEFVALCTQLSAHTIGSKDAKNRIKNFLAKNTIEGADIFTRVLLHDLKMGAEISTINKCFPGLIPEFKVQLAAKAEDLSTLKYPLIIEQKLDGCRAIAVYDGAEVKFYSRAGHEFDECGVIAEQIKQLAPGLPFVLDGEFIAQKFNPSNKTCSKVGEKGNWPFAYGLSLVKTQDKTSAEVAEFLGFYCWDLIPLDYFLSSGVKGDCDPLDKRKISLSSLFSRWNIKFNNLHLVPNIVVNSPQEVLYHFRAMRDKGWEGSMLKPLNRKYEFKRSDAVLKLKEFYNLDLRIIGAEVGQGMNADKLGALVVQDDTGTIKTKVGSGFTQEERSILWLDWLNGSLEGCIVEVCTQEKTKDGSLRFPTYVGMRFDKTTTNTEGLV